MNLRSDRASTPIAYDSVSTDIGRLWVAVSPAGLRRIDFDRPEAEFTADLRRQYGVEPRRDAHAVAAVAEQLQEYLAGRRQVFDLSIDWEGLAPFQRQAMTACAAIPYGQTASYAQVAAHLGRPGAARAVGRAMASTPLPLVIPCHRVVRSDGALGGYGGGLALKARLLALEKTHLANDQ